MKSGVLYLYITIRSLFEIFVSKRNVNYGMRKPISDTRVSFSMLINKRQIIPKGQSKMDNPEKDEDKQIKNTTQYVLDTIIRKQA